jgi:hypothetical protein
MLHRLGQGPTLCSIAILAAVALALTPAATADTYFTLDHPGELTTSRPERICTDQATGDGTVRYGWFHTRPGEANLTNSRDLDGEDCAWFGQGRPEDAQWLRLAYDANGSAVTATFYFSQNGTLAHNAGPSTPIETATGLTALELLWVTATAFAGILIWSRSLDHAVRAFGAFLPIATSLVLLTIGIREGFARFWIGHVPIALTLAIIGLYMLLRQTLEALSGGEPT